MNDIDVRKTGTAVGTPLGNPDGKASSGFLQDWRATEPRAVVAKASKQLLAEFFTSMLVLSADFKYKPAIGVRNYLYNTGGRWTLSLIAPEQWTGDYQDGFVGTCTLQADQTWTIEPSEQLRSSDQLAAEVRRFFAAFVENLDTDLALEDILPFYVRKLPYWQRLHASALSRSVRGSIMLGGRTRLSAREWCQALPAADESLLLGRRRDSNSQVA